MKYCSILEDALQLKLLFCYYYDWLNSLLINYYAIFESSHLTRSERKFPKNFILDTSNYMIHNLKFSCDSEEHFFFKSKPTVPDLLKLLKIYFFVMTAPAPASG